MAGKRLTLGTLGQKGIRRRLKTFILGVYCTKPDQNRTPMSWDIVGFKLYSRKLSSWRAIFQNGGQTVNLGTKEYKKAIKDLDIRRILQESVSKSTTKS